MSTSLPGRFQSILVPLDGSSLAEQAIPVAEAIAKRARCKLKLVLVHEPLIQLEPGSVSVKLELAMQKADRQYLKGLTVGLRERLGRPVSSAVLRGIPVAEILATHIRELGVDLVVMTSHGRGGLRRAWLGSVTDQLVRSTEIPVLVVRPREDEAPWSIAQLSEIMIPLDGSPLAEAALEPATELARLWDAEISLVQVVRPIILSEPNLTFPSSYSDQATAIRRDLAQDYIKDVAERVRESGLRSTGIAVIGGAVSQTLIDLASPERVGLMVVATHGRGGLKRLVLGSVADKLIRGANVPVLVIRPAGRRARRKPEDIAVTVVSLL